MMSKPTVSKQVSKLDIAPQLSNLAKISVIEKKDLSDISIYYNNEYLIICDEFVSLDEISVFNQFDPIPSVPIKDRRYKEWKMKFKKAALSENKISGILKQAKRPDLIEEVLLRSRKLVKEIRTIAETFYPVKRDLTNIRLSLTENEDLHLDVYDRNDLFRAFINLDYEPRIWGNSYSQSQACEILKLNKKKFGTQQNLNRTINQKLLHKPNTPKNILRIAPGTLVICDTQKVSHQIIYGRRLLAITLEK